MTLSSKQRQVVDCLDHCLVVACPGSGKTRVLVHKVAHILKVDPGARIIIVTFTAESAMEIRKRVIELVGQEFARKIASGTFHSIALNQLKQHGFKGTIIGDGQMRQYVERAVAECRLFGMEFDEASAVIEMAKTTPDYEPANDNHGRLFHAYSRLLEQNNVIDFADMLSRTVRGMREGEIQPKSCTYLMIDEAQDIDGMQYAWAVEHIIDRVDRKGSLFTVVGDDDQSIYRFRRALGYAGMMRFRDEFSAKVITLDTNYRCRSEILSSASKVILNNASRVDKSLEAARGKGGVTKATLFATPASEAAAVVDKIKDMSSANPVRAPIKYKRMNKDNTATDEWYTYTVGIQKDEWAILARNNYNLRVLAADLKAQGIPYFFNGTDLWSDRPVCLAVSLLHSLITRKKVGFDIALYFAGIGESVLDELHNEFGEDFTDLLSGKVDISKYGRGTEETLKKFLEQLPKWDKALAKQKDHRVNNAIRGAFDWFKNNLNTNRDDSDNGKKKNSYNIEYRKLNDSCEIMCNMKGSLIDRIKMVTSKPEPPKKESTTDGFEHGAVYLGTLHSSKGLEFDNVWMLSMSEGVIPDLKDLTPETHEEERRLFYVGMTRAKNNLFISAVENQSSFIVETGIPMEISTLNVVAGKTLEDLVMV